MRLTEIAPAPLFLAVLVNEQKKMPLGIVMTKTHVPRHLGTPVMLNGLPGVFAGNAPIHELANHLESGALRGAIARGAGCVNLHTPRRQVSPITKSHCAQNHATRRAQCLEYSQKAQTPFFARLTPEAPVDVGIKYIPSKPTLQMTEQRCCDAA